MAGIPIGLALQLGLDFGISGVQAGLTNAPLILGMIMMITMKDLLLKMIKLFPTLIKMALQVLNPPAFIKDLIFGLFAGIELLLNAIVDILLGKARQQVNKVPLMNNKNRRKQKCRKKRNICIKPTLLSYIMLILCPPFALLIKYGFLRGWFYVILCGLLTYYCYYFPGLIFAALHIIC